MDPRLHDPRRLVVGIGLERVQELDPGGAHVAGVERGEAALIGRARAARAGGDEQGQGQEGARGRSRAAGRIA